MPQTFMQETFDKTMTVLAREFNFFIEHQDELAREYNGKYIVIHGEKVIGAFESALEATTEAKKRFKPGEFLVQLARLGTETITKSYYSRVAI